MKLPTDKNPLRIKADAATVRVTRVFIQLAHVRVEGWIAAPNRASAFAADGFVAARLGLRSLNTNAYGTDEVNPVSLPFSFDIQNALHARWDRRETMEETLERTMAELRSARYYFSRTS